MELYGDVRLERLLRLSGEDLRRIRKTWAEIQAQLRCKHEVAVRCASLLGCYLGDFVVLLHDSNDVRTVIVGGGVLSGCTGELVRQKVVERIQRYGLECRADGAILSLGWKGAQVADLLGRNFASRPRSDLGTLGSAIFAAGEFLFARKQDGMREIKARLTGLLSNQSITLQEDSLLCDGQDPVPLSRYALDIEDVKDFLKQYSTDLGFRRSTVGDPARIVYTRWIREN